MSLYLAIETSSPGSSVALGTEHAIRGRRSLERARGHVEFLMPAIQELIGEETIDGVCVGIGPGAFTSMRVGVATAKTIAHVLSIPIVGVSSLAALAHGLPGLVCACADARRGEVYAALFCDGRRLTEDAVWVPEVLAEELRARGGALLVGDGVATYAEALADGNQVSEPRYPDAGGVLALALPAFARGETTPVAQLEPAYLRRSDAEIKWEERGVVIERPGRVKMAKSIEERA